MDLNFSLRQRARGVRFGYPRKVNKFIRLLYNFPSLGHIRPSSPLPREELRINFSMELMFCYSHKREKYSLEDEKQQTPAFPQNKIFIGFVITARLSKTEDEKSEKFYFSTFPTSFCLMQFVRDSRFINIFLVYECKKSSSSVVFK